MYRRLSGSYQATLDEKGRLHIPSILGKQLGDDATLWVSPWGNSLAAFPTPHYDHLTEQLFELRKDPANREQVSRVVENFYQGTFKNGKLLIPQELREICDSEKKIQVVGQLDHLEIWSQAVWQNRKTLQERREKSSQDDLSDLGLI